MLIERIAVMGLMQAAEAASISMRTARKWRARFEQDGLNGLLDRSSQPLKTRSTVDANAVTDARSGDALLRDGPAPQTPAIPQTAADGHRAAAALLRVPRGHQAQFLPRLFSHN